MISVPFPRSQDIEPLSCRILCREGGCFDGVVFLNAFFFEAKAKPKSFSCQTHIILKNIFIDNISRTFFLFRFARDLLPGLLKEATFVVCGSVVLHD